MGLLRLMRILKLMRHYSGWRVLTIALERSWRAICVPVFAMLMTILVLSGLLHALETWKVPEMELESLQMQRAALVPVRLELEADAANFQPHPARDVRRRRELAARQRVQQVDHGLRRGVGAAGGARQVGAQRVALRLRDDAAARRRLGRELVVLELGGAGREGAESHRVVSQGAAHRARWHAVERQRGATATSATSRFAIHSSSSTHG